MKKTEGQCCSTGSWFGWLVLIVGVLYLLVDLQVFAMPIQWYTTLFLLWGIKHMAH